MTKRPTAITVIGWYWRVGGILGIGLSLPLALWGAELFEELYPGIYMGLPKAVIFVWAFLGSLLSLLCGNGILKGRNWGRVLALILCVLGTLVPLIVWPKHPMFWFHLVSNAGFTAIMGFFLFRPGATWYFRGEELPDS